MCLILWAGTTFSAYTHFNATRDQVTLTLVDGGAGDDDLVANGVILDPSGLGAFNSGAVTPAQPAPGGGGGGQAKPFSPSTGIRANFWV